MKKNLMLGIVFLVVLIITGGLGAVVGHEIHTREVREQAAKDKSTSLSKKEAELSQKELEHKEASRVASKKFEKSKAVSSEVAETQVATPSNANNSSVVSNDNVTPVSSAKTTEQRPKKDGKTTTTTTVEVEFGPVKVTDNNKADLDDKTRAYHEAGVLNPQGDTKYDPEIESKAQSNLEKYRDE